MGKRTTVGLDIGSSGVRAAELSYDLDGAVLEKFGQISLPDDAVVDGEVHDSAAVVAALKELWSATKISTKKVSLGIANQRVVVRNVDLPNMKMKDLKAALPYQVADLLPMPVEEAILDFHPVELINDAGDEMIRGMLVAAARSTVEANVECVQRAGLHPTSVDLTSFAVLRSVGRSIDPTIETEAVVDVGARVTNVVVHSGGVPRFVRILLLGGEDITDLISERLGVHRQEAQHMKHSTGIDTNSGGDPSVRAIVEEAALRFVDEVRGSLDYYNSYNPDFPLDRVTVSGGASCLEGILPQIAAATRLPVVPADPLSTLSIGNTGLDDSQMELIKPLCAVPVGLALGSE